MTSYEKNKKSYMRYYSTTTNYSFRLRHKDEREAKALEVIEDAKKDGISLKELIISKLL